MASSKAPSFFEPGDIVRLRDTPDWGDGQVQSVVGPRVTVNFREMGKQTVNTDHVILDVVTANSRG